MGWSSPARPVHYDAGPGLRVLADSRREGQNRELDNESSMPAPAFTAIRRQRRTSARTGGPSLQGSGMIPLRDDNPAQRPPFVTRGIIVLNVLAFIYELSLADGTHEFLRDWGVVPGRLFAALTGETSLPVELSTLVTSLFLHGGWLHLIGNMWYLWIFGDNVEDRMGHVRFLLFYLGAGIFAALLNSALMPGSPTPTIGASGAIAGVLGAYAFAFPRAKVLTLVPIFFFFQIIAIPALILLGIWFAFQFVAGTMAFGAASGSGGVAWWAHIAGFVFGFLVMMLFSRRVTSRAEVVD